ncbi:MAG: hypothetical protein ABI921_09795 [Panacibacter sp.]
MDYILRTHEIFPEGGRRQLVVALWKENTNVLTMVYDVLLHTARLESNGTRRLFMVYEQGKRQPKIVFKNEYGFDAGIIDPLLAAESYGTIQFYENFYYYNLDCVTNGFLNVYTKPGETPLVSFEMEVSSVSSIVNAPPNRLPADYFNCLLMGVCWYLQLPAKNTELMSAAFSVQGQQMMRM